MVQTTCCGEGKECIVTDVSGLADPCMASCNVFYRLPDGSIWLLNKEGDDYLSVFVANDATKIDWNADPNSIEGISHRPFKAIGWGLTLDEDGNIILDKLELPKPDWNETDPDNKDFIKNKPFQTLNLDNFEVVVGELRSKSNIELHDMVDETTDGAITPKAVREALYADADKSRVQIGSGASSVGFHSITVGDGAKTSEDLSVAVGDGAETSKDLSVAIGNNSKGLERLTVAIGNRAKASFLSSVALGANSTATREFAVAVNYGGSTRTIEGVKDPTQPQDAMTKMYADSHYASLTQPQTISAPTTFDTLSMTGDTNGWVDISERLNGFSGGSIQYRKHLGVVTILGDNITPPEIPANSFEQLFTVPGIIMNGKNIRVTMDVNNRAFVSYIDTTGKFIVQAGSTAITTSQKVHFTVTYLM